MRKAFCSFCMSNLWSTCNPFWFWQRLDAPLRVLLQVILFMHRLANDHIGLTAWNLLNINKRTILTVSLVTSLRQKRTAKCRESLNVLRKHCSVVFFWLLKNTTSGSNTNKKPVGTELNSQKLSLVHCLFQNTDEEFYCRWPRWYCPMCSSL